MIELEYQPIGFLTCHFFITFIRKLTHKFIFTIFSNTWKFNSKIINSVQFLIIKIRIPKNFMHLWSKQTSEICQKVYSEFKWKIKQICLKTATLPSFAQKLLHLSGNNKSLSIFYCINKWTYQFYAFAIKSTFGSISESIELRFENNLKVNSRPLSITHCIALKWLSGFNHSNALKSKIMSHSFRNVL